jgi:hypothetical protein
VLVQNTLRDLTNPAAIDSEGRREAALSRLLPLRISLSALQARSRRVSVLLDEILDSEDDVADMCLTFLESIEPTNPQLEHGDTTAETAADVQTDSGALLTDMGVAAEAEQGAQEAAQELVETLLDVYDARLNSLCDQIEQLASTIENTQDVLELTLDNERNRIARLELLLSMAGLSVGTCSAVSGFFGMNLLSGFESAAGMFAFVTGVTILLTGSLFVTCWRQFRSISFRQRDRLVGVMMNLSRQTTVAAWLRLVLYWCDCCSHDCGFDRHRLMDVDALKNVRSPVTPYKNFSGLAPEHYARARPGRCWRSSIWSRCCCAIGRPSLSTPSRCERRCARCLHARQSA